MAKSKKDLLSNALGTKKKQFPSDKIEEITKQSYKTSAKTDGDKLQKTTLEIPRSLHIKAKMFATEQGKTFRTYIKELIEANLQENGKL